MMCPRALCKSRRATRRRSASSARCSSSRHRADSIATHCPQCARPRRADARLFGCINHRRSTHRRRATSACKLHSSHALRGNRVLRSSDRGKVVCSSRRAACTLRFKCGPSRAICTGITYRSSPPHRAMVRQTRRTRCTSLSSDGDRSTHGNRRHTTFHDTASCSSSSSPVRVSSAAGRAPTSCRAMTPHRSSRPLERPPPIPTH